MVNGLPADGKRSKTFAEPPWTQQSPPWQEIDRTLDADDLARRVDAAFGCLDMQPLFDTYQPGGSRAIRPDLLMKMILYETQRGRTSPVQWHEDLRRYQPLRWLVMGQEASLSTLYAFRERAGPLLDGLNREVLQQAIDARMTPAERGSLDGTFVEANASRHKTVQQDTLHKRLEQLQQAIEEDQQPSAPASDRPAWMAGSASGRQQQLARHQKAQECMRRLHEKNARRRKDKRQKPERIRISLSDPESACGRDKLKVFRPLYNYQVLQDLDSEFVLAYATFAQTTDKGVLQHMLSRHASLTGLDLKTLLVDAGFTQPDDIAFCESVGVSLYGPWQENDYTAAKRAEKPPKQIPKDAFQWVESERAYRCPAGHLLQFDGRTSRQSTSGDTIPLEIYRCAPEHCSACPQKAQCTSVPHKGRTVRRHQQQTSIDALCQRMQSPEARELYARRGSTVERRFADHKTHRHLRRLTGRGEKRAAFQLAVTVLVHNMLTFHNLKTQCPAANQQPPIPEKKAA
jgi:transposase